MIFKGLKLKSAQKFIQKKLSSIVKNNENGVLKIKRVGCIVDAEAFSDIAKLEVIENDLGLPPSAITFIVYFKEKKLAKEYAGLSFCDDDFGWKGKILGEDLGQFLLQPYDLLINYFQDTKKVGLQLASLHATKGFSVGFHGANAELNDLIIHSKPSQHEDFSKELKKYLTILNKI